MKISRWLLAVSVSGLILCGCGSLVAPEAEAVDPLFEATAGAKLVALGDINNDGLTDVASVSDESQPVQIHLRNVLTGKFDTYTIAGGAPLTQAEALELADLNSDGQLDIVVLISDTGFEPAAGDQEGTVVFLIQGNDPTDPADWSQVPTAGQSPPTNLTLASSSTGASGLAVADLTGDGGPDVVVLSNETDSQKVRLFANPGAALVADETAWTSSVIEEDAPDLGKVDVTDLDGDGDLDVILSVPEAKSFNLRWLQNPQIDTAQAQVNPVPTFLPSTVDPVYEVTAGATATALGDVNGDGLADVVSISDESQPVQVHLRNALTNSFDTVSIAGGAPLAISEDIALADFNGDGKQDIAVLVNDTAYAVPSAWQQDKIGALVLLLQGDDPSEPSDWTQVDALKQTNAVAKCFADAPPADCDMLFGTGEVGATDLDTGDFNADGRTDIVLTCNQRDKDTGVTKLVYLFPNPGPAAASDPTSWNRAVVTSDVTDLIRLAVEDIDTDGDEDIVVSMPDGKSFNLSWLENGNNATTWTRRFLAQQQGGGDFLAVGDIDGDGDPDLAATGEESTPIEWFKNPGPAALADGTQVPWDVFSIGSLTGSTIDQIQLIDLDADGTLECFATAEGSGYGFQRGSNVEHVWDDFTIFTTDPEAGIGRVAFADFDADGKLDFVAPLNRDGLLDDEFVMYTSVSASLWTRRLIGQQQNGADVIDLGDIDGDGDVDVAAAGASLETVQWFRNPGSEDLAPDAPQVPWDVFNIGSLSDVDAAEAEIGEINQVQLVDLDGDGELDCFVTATTTALVFVQPFDVEESWGGSALFTTDPSGTIGPVGFLNVNGSSLVDIIAPIDREGVTQDQIILFSR